MNRRDRHILITTGYGHFMGHFNLLVFPALVLPLTARLEMTMAQVLGMAFWMYLLYGITAFPWGMAADRWGARSLLTLFYVGTGLSGFAAAFFIHSPSRFSLALAVLGAFSGIYHPVALGLISREIRQVGLAMGYNGVFGSLGLISAPLLTGLLNWLSGPRAVYAAVGAANLLGLLLMAVLLPPDIHGETTKDGADDEEGQPGAYIILLVAMMLAGVAFTGSTVLLPAYFEIKNPGIFEWASSALDHIVSRNLVAATTASAIYVMGMIGQYAGGKIAERFNLKISYLLFHAITVPSAFLMGIAGDMSLVFLSFIYFFCLFGMEPLENTLVARFTPGRLRHSAFGIKFILVFGVGASALKIVGWIEKTAGIEAVFPFLGCVSLLLVGVVIFLIKKTGTGT